MPTVAEYAQRSATRAARTGRTAATRSQIGYAVQLAHKADAGLRMTVFSALSGGASKAQISLFIDRMKAAATGPASEATPSAASTPPATVDASDSVAITEPSAGDDAALFEDLAALTDANLARLDADEPEIVNRYPVDDDETPWV